MCGHTGGEAAQLSGIEGRAGRVVRVGHKDEPGARGHGGSHRVQIVHVTAQRNAHRDPTGREHGAAVDRIGRGRQHRLVAPLEVGQRQQEDDLVAAVAHGHVVTGQAEATGKRGAQSDRATVGIAGSAGECVPRRLDGAR